MSTNETPAWFREALADVPVTHAMEYECGRVSYLRWGDRFDKGNKRALVLVHGTFAHAHWWDFIAPMFADEFVVIAIDLPGCGNSDHAAKYTEPWFANCIMAVLEDAGLRWSLDSKRPKPYLVGHSFGARVCMWAGSSHPDELGGVIALDAVVTIGKSLGRGPPISTQVRHTKTAAELVNRFRLRPPQRCDNAFLVRHIAEHGVRHVSGKGWTYKFDRRWLEKTPPIDRSRLIENCRARLAWIYGKRSSFYSHPEVAKHINSELARHHGTTARSLPDAAHHLFLDSPLETVEEIRQVLLEWDDSPSTVNSLSKL